MWRWCVFRICDVLWVTAVVELFVITTEILQRLPILSRSHVALLRESLSRGEYCDESMLHRIRGTEMVMTVSLNVSQLLLPFHNLEDLQNLKSLGEEKLALAKEAHGIVCHC